MTELTLIEKEIDAQLVKARAGHKRGVYFSWIRRLLAYALKLAAAGSTFLIAIKIHPGAEQVLGSVALGAVIIDNIFSNQKRLIAEVKAGYAFEFLIEYIKPKYNAKLDMIMKKHESTRDAQIAELQQETLKEMTERIASIRTFLADSDLKALDALSLDNEKIPSRALEAKTSN